MRAGSLPVGSVEAVGSVDSSMTLLHCTVVSYGTVGSHIGPGNSDMGMDRFPGSFPPMRRLEDQALHCTGRSVW